MAVFLTKHLLYKLLFVRAADTLQGSMCTHLHIGSINQFLVYDCRSASDRMADGPGMQQAPRVRIAEGDAHGAAAGAFAGASGGGAAISPAQGDMSSGESPGSSSPQLKSSGKGGASKRTLELQAKNRRVRVTRRYAHSRSCARICQHS